MAPLRAPAAKLPLVARKNLRDEWEAKKPGFEAKIKELLGQAWTIDLDPNLIYQYATETYQSRLGDTIVWYIEPFVENLEKFTESFGSDGVQELNSACSKHQLTLAPQEETTFTYGGLTVKDGILRLVFAEDAYPVNVSEINAFNLIARNGVRQKYDPEIAAVRSAIREAVNMPDLILKPNFEANANELVKSKERLESDYDSRMGWISLAYFESLRDYLDRYKFKDDDMQQEAFQEAVSAGEVCLRVLPQWDHGRSGYNNLKVDAGVLYLDTTTENWEANVDDMAINLLDVL